MSRVRIHTRKQVGQDGPASLCHWEDETIDGTVVDRRGLYSVRVKFDGDRAGGSHAGLLLWCDVDGMEWL